LLDLGPDAARREALIEAQLEVEKLQRIVDSDLGRLARAEPGGPEAQQIVDELEQAWAQLDNWKRVVDGDAPLPAAKGHIAREGDKRGRPKLAAADTDAKPRDIDDASTKPVEIDGTEAIPDSEIPKGEKYRGEPPDSGISTIRLAEEAARRKTRVEQASSG